MTQFRDQKNAVRLSRRYGEAFQEKGACGHEAAILALR
jgi:hypothetical protein